MIPGSGSGSLPSAAFDLEQPKQAGSVGLIPKVLRVAKFRFGVWSIFMRGVFSPLRIMIDSLSPNHFPSPVQNFSMMSTREG